MVRFCGAQHGHNAYRDVAYRKAIDICTCPGLHKRRSELSLDYLVDAYHSKSQRPAGGSFSHPEQPPT